ncbi:MAG: DUF1292 domain-containing protein [Chloroflexi bacterium]|nr:MAG: DUF1292 domain-containing protein [Chloroflexota bacterium]TME54712.1 MAG: DUF1292 domain-containing protein [Chloroflexota bacterium]
MASSARRAERASTGWRLRCCCRATSNCGETSLAEDEAHPQHVTLIDEAGRERQFNLHDAFDHEGSVYYLVENVDDPSEVLLLRETAGGLETVEGEEFQRVIAALEEDAAE